jgi:hypothetical protein
MVLISLMETTINHISVTLNNWKIERANQYLASVTTSFVEALLHKY